MFGLYLLDRIDIISSIRCPRLYKSLFFVYQYVRVRDMFTQCLQIWLPEARKN